MTKNGIGKEPNIAHCWPSLALTLNFWRNGVVRFFFSIPPFIEQFHVNVSSGGNVLGACLYIAKAMCGANPIVFVGADFSFSYGDKFHGWDSSYDKQGVGNYLVTNDIFGNNVKTWRSYSNFCSWYHWVAINVPGIYINCTEGGILGSYPEGNIYDIKQMPLQEFLNMQSLCEEIRETCEKPGVNQKRIMF